MGSEAKTYKCGPLNYTLGGLLVAAGMLILGFCCLRFVSNIVGALIPLRLKALGANNITIAVIMNTIGGIFNFTVCPAVSFKSDRWRGKHWGRRGVFIYGTMPIFCAALLCFAATGPAGEFLARVLKPCFVLAPATVTIVLIGLVMVLYQFFYMFPASLLYYLYNDVIPPQFVSRVVGLVQVATTAAVAAFDFFLFRHSLTKFAPLLIMAAVVYAAGIILMCLLLREPQLPPLTGEDEKKSRGLTGMRTFFQESFSHPFYWFCALGGAFWAVGMGINTFLVFFYQNMGLELTRIGRLNGFYGVAGTAVSMAAALIITFFVDKWHPARIFVYGSMFQLIFPLVNWKWMIFSVPEKVFFPVFLAGFIISLFMINVTSLANMPFLVRTFPKSRFGQLSSAGAMFRSLVVLVMGLALGAVIDFGHRRGLGENVYRCLWTWRFFWCALGAFFYLLAYRIWLRMGGDTGYSAPAPWSESGREPVDIIPTVGSSWSALSNAVTCWDAIVWMYVAGAGAVALFGGYGDNKLVLAILTRALPAAAVLAVGWLIVRHGIVQRLPAPGERVLGGVIHHGVLFFAAIQQVLIFAAAGYQAYLVAPGDPLRSAWLWAFESLIALAAVFLIGLGNWFETRNGTRVNTGIQWEDPEFEFEDEDKNS